jgi:integration host factor subunit alpha
VKIQELHVAPLEMMELPDSATGVTLAAGFSAKLPSAPAGGFARASASANASQDVDAESPTLTKAELSELLLEQVGLNKREAKDMVEAFFDEICNALKRGDSVKLTGFGNFQLRAKVSRPGRNPKTGMEVQIPARRVVTFQASQKLKEIVDTLPLALLADETSRA